MRSSAVRRQVAFHDFEGHSESSSEFLTCTKVYTYVLIVPQYVTALKPPSLTRCRAVKWNYWECGSVNCGAVVDH